MCSGCPTIDCLRSFCLVKSRRPQAFAHLAGLGLVRMVMHCMIVKIIKLVGITGMHKTGCSGETCTYLARLELENVIVIVVNTLGPKGLLHCMCKHVVKVITLSYTNAQVVLALGTHACTSMQGLKSCTSQLPPSHRSSLIPSRSLTMCLL